MYIKSITISGFKSYKRKVHLELSRGHNVIVGSNGSGKSNIYAALEFVLSSKYDMLGSAQRKQLLHDAGQSGVVSAFVEIVFDNEDGRFPINEKLISIKRMIGAKKDEYFINQKQTTKRELNSVLESAGISKFNQHFIVPQGQIAQRVQERDNERLQLIKEIAGTRVYDQNRAESTKLMSDADNKREKVQSIIDYFKERLEELEAEKEELAKFEQLDKKRRCIEFKIYDGEKERTQAQLDEIRRSEGKQDKKNEKLHAKLKRIRTEMDEVRKERDSFNMRLEKTNKEMKKKRKALHSLQRLVLTLQTKLDELKKDADIYHGKKDEYAKQLKEVEERIDVERENLTKTTDNFQAIRRRKDELKKQYDSNNTVLQNLYAKQERLNRFKSKKQRDRVLKEEMNGLRAELNEEEKECASLSKANEEIDRKINEYVNQLNELQNDLKQSEKALAENEKERKKLRKARNERQNERKLLWREENELKKQAEEIEVGLKQNEEDFKHTMHLNQFKSYRELKRIQKDIEQKGEHTRYRLSGKIYGPLLENFTIDDAKYNIAVEAAAGNKLFYYLVETDVVATELIKIMHREKIDRVTFIPLNRCDIDIRRQREYPRGSADVIAMIKLLKGTENVPNVDGALIRVFGNTLIPKDMDIGFDYAVRENYQCVTLNGDIITSGGAMDGGFNESKYRRMKCWSAIRENRDRMEDIEQQQKENREKLERVQQEILRIDNAIKQNEQNEKQYKSDLNASTEKVMEIEEEMEMIRKLKDQRLEQLEKHEANISNIRQSIKSREEETKQPMQTQLDEEEQEQLNTLTDENEELEKQMAALVQSATDAEMAVDGIQSLLRDNLNQQKKELLAKLKKCDEFADSEQTKESTDNEWQMEKEKRDKLEEEIVDDEQNMDKWSKNIKALDKSLSELSENEQTLVVQIEEHSIDSEKLVGKQQGLEEKFNQLFKYIRDLGALPAHDVAALDNKSKDYLQRQLNKIKKQLEKYANVNKKAMDQYTSFSKERRKLHKRNEEQLEDKQHIKQLMEHLDTKKDDALRRTFQAINARFAESFKQLVSRGNAKLILFERKEEEKDEEEHDFDEEEFDEYSQSQTQTQSSQRRGGRVRRRRRSSNMRGRNRRKSSLMSGSQQLEEDGDDRKYAGVGIRVAFGKDAEAEEEEEEEEKEEERARDMRQLSGGQQTVVALALIFAIQQCDPSPFYVFDEIDAALDQQYRKAVADIISSRKVNTQFITTTFRPEILHEADKCFVVDFKAKISTIKQMDPADVDIAKFT